MERLIDFHTHILPEVDDGSRSVDESLLMLKTLFNQETKTVVLTPHFYADDESVDTFLRRRNAAYERLMEKAPLDAPNMVLGAEVRYYPGISHLQDLEKLRIEGTKFLLLEMPFSAWTEYVISEVIDIAGRGGITLVMAHIERYLSFVNSEVISRLINNGVLFQISASFFSGFFNSVRALKMLKGNRIHFIGSDCHNVSDRAPNMNAAYRTIIKNLGEAAAEEFFNYGNELFLQNKI